MRRSGRWHRDGAAKLESARLAIKVYVQSRGNDFVEGSSAAALARSFEHARLRANRAIIIYYDYIL